MKNFSFGYVRSRNRHIAHNAWQSHLVRYDGAAIACNPVENFLFKYSLCMNGYFKKLDNAKDKMCEKPEINSGKRKTILCECKSILCRQKICRLCA